MKKENTIEPRIIFGESDRRISLNTLKREFKLLSLQECNEAEKFSLVYRKANLDVVDWLLQKQISTWEELKEEMESKETSDAKLISLIKVCSDHRLPSENVITFLEEAIRNFKSIGNFPEENLISILVRITWPGKLDIYEKMINAKSVEDLLTRTKIMEETYKNQKKNDFCSLCNKKGHKASKCWNNKKKTETQNGI